MKTNLNLPKEATFKGPALIWKRIFAFVIDILIIDFVIGTPFRDAFSRIIPGSDFMQSYNFISNNPKIAGLLSLFIFIFGMLALLYFSLMEYKTGQTLGKMLMNIRIESEAKNLTFLACIMRSAYLIMLFPFILLWIIDPLFMIFSKQKKRLSEILSKTRTVEIYLLR